MGCRGTLQEVEEVLTRARMFQYKPDGDVTFMAVQDAKGIPISTFQDPLHYPHNTKFLAPGLSHFLPRSLARQQSHHFSGITFPAAVTYCLCIRLHSRAANLENPESM